MALGGCHCCGRVLLGRLGRRAAPEHRSGRTICRMQLSGVRVVVTGATSGLGAAMADALLRAGATVAVAARPGPRLDEVVDRWTRDGLAAVALPMDVRHPDSVEMAVAQSMSRWGGVDVVVNDAGIGMRTVNPRFFSDPRPFFEVSPRGFRGRHRDQPDGLFPRRPSFRSAVRRPGTWPLRQRVDESRDDAPPGLRALRAVAGWS